MIYSWMSGRGCGLQGLEKLTEGFLLLAVLEHFEYYGRARKHTSTYVTNMFQCSLFMHVKSMKKCTYYIY